MYSRNVSKSKSSAGHKPDHEHAQLQHIMPPHIVTDSSGQDHEDDLGLGSTYESAMDIPTPYIDIGFAAKLEADQEKTDHILEEIENQLKGFAADNDNGVVHQQPAEHVHESSPQVDAPTATATEAPPDTATSPTVTPICRNYAMLRQSIESPFTVHANRLHAQILYATSILLEAKSVMSQRLILSGTTTIGKLDAWETVLIKTLVNLKPPKFWRKQLQEILKVKLREMAEDMDWICRVLMKVTINSRIALNMISKVHRRVLTQIKTQNQGHDSGQGSNALAEAPKKILGQAQLSAFNGRKPEKVQIDAGSTKSILELTVHGLKLYNVKDEESKLVNYDDLTYLERKSMLSSFIAETQSVIYRASSLITRLGGSCPDFQSTQLKFRAKLRFNSNLIPENLIEREIIGLNKVTKNVKGNYADLERLKELKGEMERFCAICEHVASLFKTSACGFIELQKKQRSLIRGTPGKRLRKFKTDEQLLLTFNFSKAGMVPQQEIATFLNGIEQTGQTAEATVKAIATTSASIPVTSRGQKSSTKAQISKSIKTLKNAPSRSSKKERIISPQSSTETLSEADVKSQHKGWGFWKSKHSTIA